MARLAFHPLAPGVHLMRQLRLPIKLAIMGLALLIPMAVLVVDTFVNTRHDIAVARQELVGARHVALLNDLASGLQAHREALGPPHAAIFIPATIAPPPCR